METEKWREEYDTVRKSMPTEGYILKSIDGSPCKVNIEYVTGKEPFMYGLAYLPQIVGAPVGWFARSINDRSSYGFKLILLPKAREMLLREFGVSETQVQVDGFKVIRSSTQGHSLLVELYRDKNNSSNRKTEDSISRKHDLSRDVPETDNGGDSGNDVSDGSVEVRVGRGEQEG